MESTITACTEFEEAVIFLSYFKDLEDPRQQGKVAYPLGEILLLYLLAVLAGAETFVDIALFDEKKRDLLRRFRPFKDGTPTHDHLGDIMAVLDAEQFQRCFAAWVAKLTGIPVGVVAIDGKTVRHSHDRKRGKAARRQSTWSRPSPSVSASCSGRSRLRKSPMRSSPFQSCWTCWRSKERSSPLTPWGCQRVIVQKIIDKKADYVLALKGNQSSPQEDVTVFVAEQKSRGFKDTTISQAETVDGDHGRIETRATTVIHDVAWLQQRHDWPGLNGLVIIDSRREINEKVETETRFYPTSLTATADVLGPIVRSHWAIENSLQWVMDMVFRDDECRVRTEHAPANFATIKHMAHNLLRLASGKHSLRLRRKAAAWDDAFLVGLVRP